MYKEYLQSIAETKQDGSTTTLQPISVITQGNTSDETESIAVSPEIRIGEKNEDLKCFSEVPDIPSSRQDMITTVCETGHDLIETPSNDISRRESSISQASSRRLSKMDGGGSGWVFVRKNVSKVIELGVQEGILAPRTLGKKAVLSTMQVPTGAESKTTEQKVKPADEINIPVNEISMIYEAIPFLPLTPAILCMVLNFVLPGTGTLLSGFFLLCCGHPRVQIKEARVVISIMINMFIGISQFATITFLLVGWIWSIAWGALLISHSLKYRSALLEKRQTSVATSALEALTKETLVRRREVRKLVRFRRKKK